MTYDFRTAAQTIVAKMEQDELIRVFDSLRPKQRVKVALRATMGHGPSESGTPTEYIVGRRGKGRYGETVGLLPGDGRPAHAMSKVTLMKRKDSEGNMYVSVALGDMGATLLSIEPA